MQCIPSSQHITSTRAKELEDVVTNYVATCVQQVNRTWPHLNYQTPTVQYDLRGRTAGLAYCQKNLIKLNPILLHENTTSFKETVFHEIAHVVSFQLYGRRGVGHGPDWKYVMTRLGVEPKRCHQMDTTNAKVRTVAKTAIYCTCCNKHVGDATAKVINTLHRRHSLCCRARCTTEKPVLVSDLKNVIEYIKAERDRGMSYNRVVVDAMIKYNFKELSKVREIAAEVYWK